MRFWSYKYRFSLQKEVKNQKYFFIFEKYNISAFQRTFDRLHILKLVKMQQIQFSWAEPAKGRRAR